MRWRWKRSISSPLRQGKEGVLPLSWIRFVHLTSSSSSSPSGSCLPPFPFYLLQGSSIPLLPVERLPCWRERERRELSGSAQCAPTDLSPVLCGWCVPMQISSVTNNIARTLKDDAVSTTKKGAPSRGRQRGAVLLGETREEAKVRELRHDPTTYLTKPKDEVHFAGWNKTFEVNNQVTEVSSLLSTDSALRKLHASKCMEVRLLLSPITIGTVLLPAFPPFVFPDSFII
jgi:hypothetical protein